MWGNKSNGEKKDEGGGLVAVAVDKDKSSQHALKWAVDHIVTKGQTILLVHVNHRQPPSVSAILGSHSFIANVSHNLPSPNRRQIDSITRELFLPFRCFCTRKEIHCMDVLLEDTDISKAIIEFVSHSAIESLVVGTSSRSPFVRRFKNTDVPTSITKGAPDFCTVYVISKGKVSSVRSASRPAPTINNALHNQVTSQPQPQPNLPITHISQTPPKEEASIGHRMSNTDAESIRSPFSRGGRSQHTKSYGDLKLQLPESDISFASNSTTRPSMESIEFIDNSSGRTLSQLVGEDNLDHRPSLDLVRSMHNRALNLQYIGPDLPSSPHENGTAPWLSGTMDDVEAEMRRLKLELKQTMDMYSTACKEALVAKQKARELHRWKIEEEQRLEMVRLAEEAALAIAEKEKTKCKAAIEAAEAAQKIAELEAQKRINAEMKAVKEAEEKKAALNALAHTDVRYRKYTIEEIEIATEYFHEGRKIGEGGYGPVYRCYLDHTEVAIKVLRPDAAQGRSQFQQEVEVLSCIRHPNMVLLLGACPEYGCLVYEYLANGSLEDRLFQRGNTPVLPWQLRFRIAAEIGTGLLFLHQTKPEPLVHRDLKPGNILLDRNYVSKISDVGLARLVPPSVANNVTQYRMTSTAGTFCYIDPEYQQTGMLGVKSDIYSLGIMLLQIITGRPPMGLAHHVDHAIEKGTFSDMLDPAVKDWPLQEALSFAKIALQCAELRRKDRPDLGTVVLPELQRLRALADKNMHQMIFNAAASPNNQSHVSILQDIMSDPQFLISGSDSSKA